MNRSGEAAFTRAYRRRVPSGYWISLCVCVPCSIVCLPPDGEQMLAVVSDRKMNTISSRCILPRAVLRSDFINAGLLKRLGVRPMLGLVGFKLGEDAISFCFQGVQVHLTRRSPATTGDQARKRKNCKSLHRSMTQHYIRRPNRRNVLWPSFLTSLKYLLFSILKKQIRLKHPCHCLWLIGCPT